MKFFIQNCIFSILHIVLIISRWVYLLSVSIKEIELLGYCYLSTFRFTSLHNNDVRHVCLKFLLLPNMKNSPNYRSLAWHKYVHQICSNVFKIIWVRIMFISFISFHHKWLLKYSTRRNIFTNKLANLFTLQRLLFEYKYRFKNKNLFKDYTKRRNNENKFCKLTCKYMQLYHQIVWYFIENCSKVFTQFLYQQ